MKPRPPFRPGARVFRVTAGRLYVGRVARLVGGVSFVKLLGQDGGAHIDAHTARRWGSSPAEARKRTARNLAKGGRP